MKSVSDDSAKIIPCVVDTTALPALISDRKYIDFADKRNGIEELLQALTGIRTKRERLRAIQAALDEMDVSWITHPMLPPMVCCPRCGETDGLQGWEDRDPRYDATYAGMMCTKCNWSDGGEM